MFELCQTFFEETRSIPSLFFVVVVTQETAILVERITSTITEDEKRTGME